MNAREMNLGFSEHMIHEANLNPGLFLGRIVAQHKKLYKVATVHHELLAEISGALRFSSRGLADYPAVGDFVMIDREDDTQGHAIIHQVLNRKSIFVRRAAGSSHELQIVAANIDTIFICMSLNHDFNLRRLERYLSISWESKAKPVVVLTKADLCVDVDSKIVEINKVAPGVDVVITSSHSEDGYQSVLPYIFTGQTVAFLGSSGVGKSTLINRLIGENLIVTRETTKDDKGRHATTRRELFLLPSGGAVIDTPGMREVGVESINLEKTFSEIDELAKQCKFKNCHHENEPGCAVRTAIDAGLLTETRLLNYKKLKNEANYDGLDARQIDSAKTKKMYAGFDGAKNARAYLKAKRR